ncbi:MAG: MogA/MoaB family molybdenum cofactor biosynthesis protein [Nitrososphaeria archaeon]
MKSYDLHRVSAPSEIKCSVITVSTSRYSEALKGHRVEDVSGSQIVKALMEKGYTIISKKIVSDNIQMIRKETLRSVYEENCNVVILTGGTGLTSSDVTIEALFPLFDKELPGFGEIFRYKTFSKAESVALMSRASAGLISKCAVFCMPGSPDAVETALELIINELPHIVKHACE